VLQTIPDRQHDVDRRFLSGSFFTEPPDCDWRLFPELKRRQSYWDLPFSLPSVAFSVGVSTRRALRRIAPAVTPLANRTSQERACVKNLVSHGSPVLNYEMGFWGLPAEVFCWLRALTVVNGKNERLLTRNVGPIGNSLAHWPSGIHIPLE
jgi:hypothetical protein